MKERLIYIDQLRGIAILLVVMGHFLQYNTVEATDNKLFSGIYSFHMPLFMFISGYVAFKTTKISIFDNYYAFLTKKATSLLLPFFAWPLLVNKFFFTNEFNYDFITTLRLLVTDPRIELWFLWYLFFLSILYSVFLLVSSLINKRNSIIIDACIVIGLLALLFLLHVLHVAVYIDSFIQYFGFFFVGVFLAKYDVLQKIVLNINIFSIFLITFIVLCQQYSFNDPDFHSAGFNLILKVVISTSAIAALYYIVRNIRWNSYLDRVLRLWGTYSIVIYTTHFSFIEILSKQYLLPPMHVFFLIIIDLSISILIILACMAIFRIVELSPPLNLFLYGNKKMISGNKNDESITNVH